MATGGIIAIRAAADERRIPAVRETAGEAMGADRVRLREASVVVDSAADMPDWEFRDYRRTAILFRDRQYFVAEKRLLPGGAYRYVLQPWGDSGDLPGRTIVYDAEYVTARDAAARTTARRDGVSAALLFVSPLLGFLPARTKLMLDDRYGFDPQVVTRQSVFVERILAYSLPILLGLGGLAGMLDGWFAYLWAFTAAVVVDLIMRTSPSENGEPEQPGFWEWAIPGWKRRAKNA